MKKSERRSAASRAQVGRQNHSSGAAFEQLISAANDFYRDVNYADIDKTPEPLRVIGRLPNGHFECIFSKKAQPDYTGLRKSAIDGHSIAVKFEAKHTISDRIRLSSITPEQFKRLDSYTYQYGADCFVLVSFDYKLFYRIPWVVFSTMKERFGRQYLLPEEIQAYRVKQTNGVLDYLGYFNGGAEG